MTLSLHIDAARWRAHLTSVRDAVPALVPVIKGNGYGFGNMLLAAEAARLGVDTVAVGAPDEVAEVAAMFPGDVLVLEPWHPAFGSPIEQGAVIRTASSVEAIRALALLEVEVRVVVEGATSMHRFGMQPHELADALSDDAVAGAIRDKSLRIEGLALHLPIAQPAARNVAVLTANGDVQPTGRVRESLGWLGIWAQFLETSGLGEVIASDVWVSHLDDLELSALTELSGRGTTLRSRLGTTLWLGDPEAAVAKATVLGVHRVAKGDRVGYRQVRAPRNCWLVVLGGGTAHGVAMEAPASPTSVRRRVVSAGTGALEAVGRALSPYSIGGRQRWFAEPPHMQVSLVWLPERVTPPTVGDEVDVVVRMTTAHFDRIVGLD